MLKEFLATVRQLSQAGAGADLNKFYDQVDQMIKFDHDQSKLDQIYDKSTASTEKLANAVS